MRTQQHAEPETLRFRGATLDEAIELAEQSLGPRTRVVAANHIRRGGIGGFFASDLGVEVSVVLDDETIEEALDRIVEETAVQEREKWRDRAEPQQEHVTPLAPMPVPAPVPAEIRPPASSFAAALRRVDDSLTEEVTAAPAPTVVPAPAVVAAAPASAALPVARTQTAPTSSASLGSRMERLEAAFASLRAGDAPVPAPARSTVATPTRRQVELVVAAADQLIESIIRRGEMDRLCVRVVMRGSTGAEIEAAIEAGAHWVGQDEVR